MSGPRRRAVGLAAVLHAPSYCFAAESAAASVRGLIRHVGQAGVQVSLNLSSTDIEV